MKQNLKWASILLALVVLVSGVLVITGIADGMTDPSVAVKDGIEVSLNVSDKNYSKTGQMTITLDIANDGDRRLTNVTSTLTVPDTLKLESGELNKAWQNMNYHELAQNSILVSSANIPFVPDVDDPGTQEPGNQDPGTQDPGTQDPGTQKPGDGSNDWVLPVVIGGVFLLIVAIVIILVVTKRIKLNKKLSLLLLVGVMTMSCIPSVFATEDDGINSLTVNTTFKMGTEEFTVSATVTWDYVVEEEPVMTREYMEYVLSEMAWTWYFKGSTYQYDSTALNSDTQHLNNPLSAYSGGMGRIDPFATMEDATADSSVFTVCSGFCFDVYNSALQYPVLGHKLNCLTMTLWRNTSYPDDMCVLRWHTKGKDADGNVIKYNSYDTTYNVTYDCWYDTDEVYDFFANYETTMRPGDIIVFDNPGHAMLYVGNGIVMDANGGKYSMDTGTDEREDDGAVSYNTMEKKFFNPDNKNFYVGDLGWCENSIAIVRPLDALCIDDGDGDPSNDLLDPDYVLETGKLNQNVSTDTTHSYKTSDFGLSDVTKTRLEYPGMTISKTTSITPYGTAAMGANITYTVSVVNHSDNYFYCDFQKDSGNADYAGQTYENLWIVEQIPEGTELFTAMGAIIDGNTLRWNADIPAGETRNFTYTVKVTGDLGDYVVSPSGWVANIATPEISNLIGGTKLPTTVLGTMGRFFNDGRDIWNSNDGYKVSASTEDATAFAERIYQVTTGLDLQLPTIEQIMDIFFHETTVKTEYGLYLHHSGVTRYMFSLNDKAPNAADQIYYDMLVDGYYGGMWCYDDLNGERRINELRADYIEAGDILIYMDLSEVDDFAVYEERSIVDWTVMVYLGNERYASLNSDGRLDPVNTSFGRTSAFSHDLFVCLRPRQIYENIMEEMPKFTGEAPDLTEEDMRQVYVPNPSSILLNETGCKQFAEMDITDFKWLKVNGVFPGEVYGKLGIDIITNGNNNASFATLLKNLFEDIEEDTAIFEEFGHRYHAMTEPRYGAEKQMDMLLYYGGPAFADEKPLTSMSQLHPGDVVMVGSRTSRFYVTTIYQGDGHFLLNVQSLKLAGVDSKIWDKLYFANDEEFFSWLNGKIAPFAETLDKGNRFNPDNPNVSELRYEGYLVMRPSRAYENINTMVKRNIDEYPLTDGEKQALSALTPADWKEGGKPINLVGAGGWFYGSAGINTTQNITQSIHATRNIIFKYVGGKLELRTSRDTGFDLDSRIMLVPDYYGGKEMSASRTFKPDDFQIGDLFVGAISSSIHGNGTSTMYRTCLYQGNGQWLVVQNGGGDGTIAYHDSTFVYSENIANEWSYYYVLRPDRLATITEIDEDLPDIPQDPRPGLRDIADHKLSASEMYIIASLTFDDWSANCDSMQIKGILPWVYEEAGIDVAMPKYGYAALTYSGINDCFSSSKKSGYDFYTKILVAGSHKKNVTGFDFDDLQIGDIFGGATTALKSDGETKVTIYYGAVYQGKDTFLTFYDTYNAETDTKGRGKAIYGADDFKDITWSWCYLLRPDQLATEPAPYDPDAPDLENGFTVTWLAADGTILEKDLGVVAGTIPTYDGIRPYVSSEKVCFIGWDKEITAVTGDVTYTAQFGPMRDMATGVLTEDEMQIIANLTLSDWGKNAGSRTLQAVLPWVFKEAGVDITSAELGYVSRTMPQIANVYKGGTTTGKAYYNKLLVYGSFGSNANGVGVDESKLQIGDIFCGYYSVKGTMMYYVGVYQGEGKFLTVYDDAVIDGDNVSRKEGKGIMTIEQIEATVRNAEGTNKWAYRWVLRASQLGDPGFTVTWVNANGTVLETDVGLSTGDMPSYDGARPYNSSEKVYFIGWDKEIAPVTGDVTYTAKFAPLRDIVDAELSIAEKEIIANLTLKDWGRNAGSRSLEKILPWVFKEAGVDITGAELGYVSRTMPQIANVYRGGTTTGKAYYNKMLLAGTFATNASGLGIDEAELQIGDIFCGYYSVKLNPTDEQNKTLYYTAVYRGDGKFLVAYDKVVVGEESNSATGDSGIMTFAELEATMYNTTTWSNRWVLRANQLADPGFTVNWVDADGTVLETDTGLIPGELPVYNGERPYNSSEKVYFTGWDKEITPATGDVTYTAVYAPLRDISVGALTDAEMQIIANLTLSDWGGNAGSRALEKILPWVFKEAGVDIAGTELGYVSRTMPQIANVYKGTSTTGKNYYSTILAYGSFGTDVNGIGIDASRLEVGDIFCGYYSYEGVIMYYVAVYQGDGKFLTVYDVPTVDGETVGRKAGSGIMTFDEIEATVQNADGTNKWSTRWVLRVNQFADPGIVVTWQNHDGSVLDTNIGLYEGDMPSYNGTRPYNKTEKVYFTGWDKDISPVTGNVTYIAQFAPLRDITAEKLSIAEKEIISSLTLNDWAKNAGSRKMETVLPWVFKEAGIDITNPAFGYQSRTQIQIKNTFFGTTTVAKAFYNKILLEGSDGENVTGLGTDLIQIGDIFCGMYTLPKPDGSGSQFISYVAVYQGDGKFLTVYDDPTVGTSSITIEEGRGILTWDEIEATMKTADGTATWNYRWIFRLDQLTDITVTWKNHNGDVLETDYNVPYGSLPTYDGGRPYNASEAVTFAGWDKAVTSIIGDTTFTATFTDLRDMSAGVMSPVEQGILSGLTIEDWNAANISKGVENVMPWAYKSAGININERDYSKLNYVAIRNLIREDDTELTNYYRRIYVEGSYATATTGTGVATLQVGDIFASMYNASITEESVTKTEYMYYTAVYLGNDKFLVVYDKPVFVAEKEKLQRQEASGIMTIAEMEATMVGSTEWSSRLVLRPEQLNQHVVTWTMEDGTVLDSAYFASGETPVYGGSRPYISSEKVGFTGWDRAYEAVTCDSVYIAQFAPLRDMTAGKLTEDEMSIIANLTLSDWGGNAGSRVMQTVLPWVFKEAGIDITNTAFGYQSRTQVQIKNTFFSTTTVAKAFYTKALLAGSAVENRTDLDTNSLQIGDIFCGMYLLPKPDGSGSQFISYVAVYQGGGKFLTVYDDPTVGTSSIKLNAGSGILTWDEIEATMKTADNSNTWRYSWIFRFEQLANIVITWKDADGTVLETDSVADGTAAYGTVPTYDGNAPAKAPDAQYTYTWTGWNKTPAAAIGDVTYTATYDKTVNTYTVTWKDENGDVLKTDTDVPYGTVPTYNGTAPAKEGDVQFGYNWTGWDVTPSAVTGDVTYTAVYEQYTKEYTITFLNGTEELQKTDVPYGTVPVYTGARPYNSSEKEYFIGWDNPVVAVTGEATYTAQFAPLRDMTAGELTAAEKEIIANLTLSDWASNAGSRTMQTVLPWVFKEAGIDITNPAFGYQSRTQINIKNTFFSTTTIAKAFYTKVLLEGSAVENRTDLDTNSLQTGDIFCGMYTLPNPDGSGNKIISYVAVYQGGGKFLTVYDDPTVVDSTIKLNAGSGILTWDEIEATMKTADSSNTWTYSWIFRFEQLANIVITWQDADGTVLETDSVADGTVAYGALPTYDGGRPYSSAAEYFVGWNKAISNAIGDMTFTAEYEPLRAMSDGKLTDLEESILSGLTVADWREFGSKIGIQNVLPWFYKSAGIDIKEEALGYSNLNYTSIRNLVKKTTTALDNYYRRMYVEGTYATEVENINVSNLNLQAGDVLALMYKASITKESVTKTGYMYPTALYLGNGKFLVVYEKVAFKDSETSLAVANNACDIMTITELEATRVGSTTWSSYYVLRPELLTRSVITWKDGDGNVLKTEYVEAGTVPAYTGETPTKTADAQYTYTWNGNWDTTPVAADGDATYTATFDQTLNTYTVTWYDSDGTTVLHTDEGETAVPYGTVPTYDGVKPTVFGQDVYLSGWTTEVVAVTGDVSYTAQYSSLRDITTGALTEAEIQRLASITPADFAYARANRGSATFTGDLAYTYSWFYKLAGVDVTTADNYTKARTTVQIKNQFKDNTQAHPYYDTVLVSGSYGEDASGVGTDDLQTGDVFGAVVTYKNAAGTNTNAYYTALYLDDGKFLVIYDKITGTSKTANTCAVMTYDQLVGTLADTNSADGEWEYRWILRASQSILPTT